MNKFLENILQRHVIANILMAVFIVGGLLSAQSIRQEVLPTTQSKNVQISVAFDGAQPAEIETAILLPIENAIRGMEGLKKVQGVAREGLGTVTLTLLRSANPDQMLGDIKNAIDRIETFPLNVEEPVVSIPAEIEKVMSLVVSGDQPLLWLRQTAENIRDDLLTEKGLTKVQLAAPRDQEITAEISEKTLRVHGLSLEDVALRIRGTAQDLAGGTIYTPQADIALRTNERREWAHEFSDIIIKETKTGLPLRLSDIATLQDGFGNSPIEAWYNGKPAIQIDIFTAGAETPTSVEEVVKDYLLCATQKYKGVSLDIFENDAQTYRDRLSLLIDNAFLGLVLVMIVLALFLTPRLAFWVMIGIPTSLLGGLMLLPLFGATINEISLFAFIVTIGVVVDDAIMLGEAIHANRSKGMDNLSAAVKGLKEMGVTILLAVSTTILVFMPMFFISRPMGTMMEQIPAVVVSVLLVSLIECLFVLSTHLAQDNPQRPWLKTLSRPQERVNAWLENFTRETFRRFVRTTLLRPMAILCLALSLLFITFSAIVSGMIGFIFTPPVQSDTVIAQATLPYGSPKAQSIAIQDKMVTDAQAVFAESGMRTSGIFSLIGVRLDEGEIETESLAGSHYISVLAALPPEDERVINGIEFARQWQERFGDPGGLEALTFTGETNVTGGEPIQMELFHPDEAVAREAALKLGERMQSVAGLTAIDDGLRAGKPELKIKLKDNAVQMGLTAGDIARQVRHRFYGAEALRISRNGNDVKMLVRLPEKERQQRSALDHTLIKTPGGSLVPLTELVTITSGRSTTTLARRDGKRIFPVTADIMIGVSDDAVEDVLKDSLVPQILTEYPGLTVEFAGDEEETDGSMEILGNGFLITLCIMYALLALRFNSYVQPLLVLSIIPFACIGAVWGHILMGYDISIISIIGILAMAGVVVNDSLVLVTAYDRFRMQRVPHVKAITEATCSRLRPILLTTLTTCLGLMPMMLETSEQAQFLIPMAVSMVFGLAFGTFIVLCLMPVLLRLFGHKKIAEHEAIHILR
jgi:multidrug efflux pump subunit AcrB